MNSAFVRKLLTIPHYPSIEAASHPTSSAFGRPQSAGTFSAMDDRKSATATGSRDPKSEILASFSHSRLRSFVQSPRVPIPMLRDLAGTRLTAKDR
jgi:hypothetical protein